MGVSLDARSEWIKTIRSMFEDKINALILEAFGPNLDAETRDQVLAETGLTPVYIQSYHDAVMDMESAGEIFRKSQAVVAKFEEDMRRVLKMDRDRYDPSSGRGATWGLPSNVERKIKDRIQWHRDDKINQSPTGAQIRKLRERAERVVRTLKLTTSLASIREVYETVCSELGVEGLLPLQPDPGKKRK